MQTVSFKGPEGILVTVKNSEVTRVDIKGKDIFQNKTRLKKYEHLVVKAIEYATSFDSEADVVFNPDVWYEEDGHKESSYTALVFINTQIAYYCQSVFAEETKHIITSGGLNHYIGPNQIIKAIRDTCPETGNFVVSFEDNCSYVTSNHLIGFIDGDKIDWQTK